MSYSADIYVLKIPNVSQKTFLHEILTILARFFLKYECFQFREGVII
jgi:hypothetical protein